MRRKDSMILGANHQFLYLEGLTDPAAHTDSLERLARDERIDALDCWVWAAEPFRSREIAALRASGKTINYNIGDRSYDPKIVYAAPDEAGKQAAWDIVRRELDAALSCGAQKIVLGSGPDFPDGRPAAMDRLAAFLEKVCAYVGPGVTVTIEPTDRDMDKRYLLGPLAEAASLVRAVRARGHLHLGILLDMGHIPILPDTIENAASTCADTLEHIHLGNAIVRDAKHPLFGDKHVPWGIAGGEYDQPELNRMIRALRDVRYLAPGRRPTVTFEMRPFEGMPPEDSLGAFIRMLDEAWAQTERQEALP